MTRIAVAFFASAVLYAFAAVMLCIFMGASNDLTLAPVDSHMSILGWASLAGMGAFYGIAGEYAPPRLAWGNLIVSNVGNLITLPTLAMQLRGDARLPHVLALGQLLIATGLLLFGSAVVAVSRRAPQTI
jgi:hypothetical protein